MVPTITTKTTNTLSNALRPPWVEPLARLGYAARGVVYALVGMLAIQTAFGARGRQETDTRTALQWVAGQSTVLLWLLALGLFGYALWRVVQTILDPAHKGTNPKVCGRKTLILSFS